VEPNLLLLPALQENIKKAGLEDKYTIIPCGADATALLQDQYNIQQNSVDTIVCIRVLCTVPRPEETIRGLYSLLKPRGQFLLFEHISARKSVVSMYMQAIYNLPWPTLFAGCYLNRPTDEILKNIGTWESIEMEKAKDSTPFDVIPHFTGKFVKA